MISNRIALSKSKIKEVILKIEETADTNFRFLNRSAALDKDPFYFFQELGIDIKDAVAIIKSLTIEDYQYTQYATKNKYEYMHIFHKQIFNKIAYIKIAFKSDKTIVISFHEKMFEN